MQQAVKKDRGEGVILTVPERVMTVGIERPKPKLIHIVENIPINSGKPRVSPKGKRTKNSGLCFFFSNNLLYLHTHRLK